MIELTVGAWTSDTLFKTGIGHKILALGMPSAKQTKVQEEVGS